MIGSSIFTVLCKKFTVESFMRFFLFLLLVSDAAIHILSYIFSIFLCKLSDHLV